MDCVTRTPRRRRPKLPPRNWATSGYSGGTGYFAARAGFRYTLLVTDQPYGVEYDPEWRKRAGVNNSNRRGKVRNDDRSDWREVWALFPGDVAYIWHGALHASTVSDSLESCGFQIRSQIVWAKPSLVMHSDP